MDMNAQMELFSLAYIRAVSANVGYQVTRPELDDDSVDGILMARGGRRLEFQAKATTRNLLHGQHLRFPLPIKNYDDLRADTQLPRILIVLLMPSGQPEWLQQTSDELCLRHCAYWKSLEGCPESPNTYSVTVHIPIANIFSGGQLIDLMTKVERGDALC